MKHILTIVLSLVTIISVKAQTRSINNPQQKMDNTVGINTNFPEAALDVNGNVRVKRVNPYKKENYLLSWSPKEGRITKVTSPPLLFNYKKYKVYLRKTGENSFNPYFKLNTKINSEDYTLIVSNYHIKSRHNEENDRTFFANRYGATVSKYHSYPIVLGPGTLYNGSPHNRGGGTSALGIWSAVGNDGNWQIVGNMNWADVKRAAGSPYDDEFYWEIGVLIVSKNYMSKSNKPLRATHNDTEAAQGNYYNYTAEKPDFVQ